jgi:DUF4097 and DUF4098 domain-containing protein YvlB
MARNPQSDIAHLGHDLLGRSGLAGRGRDVELARMIPSLRSRKNEEDRMNRLKVAQYITIAVIASAMLSGVWGCNIEEQFGVAIKDSANTVEATRQVTQTFQVEGLADLRVESSNGYVNVESADVTSISVTASLRSRGDTLETAQERVDAIVLDFSQSGDTILLRYRASQQSDPVRKYSDVSFDVIVPRQADVTAETSNGDIAVRGIEGRVSLDTANGAIDLRNLVGVVNADTANGAIDVDLVSGVLNLETSNGEIDIEDVQATVDARTSNGRIEFSGELVGDTHRFRTSNGTIDVRVPADASIAFSASTDMGSIRTSLPLVGDTEGRDWNASLNPPAAQSVELHTNNGSIRIDAR